MHRISSLRSGVTKVVSSSSTRGSTKSIRKSPGMTTVSTTASTMPSRPMNGVMRQLSTRSHGLRMTQNTHMSSNSLSMDSKKRFSTAVVSNSSKRTSLMGLKGLSRGVSRTAHVVSRSHVSQGLAKRSMTTSSSSSSSASIGTASSFSGPLGVFVGIISVAGVSVLVFESSKVQAADKGKGTHQRQPSSDMDTPQTVENGKKFKYIIIGGGTAGFAALKTLIKRDPEGEILLVCGEDRLPYSRPPLSKELWLTNRQNRKNTTMSFRDWEGKAVGIQYASKAFYENNKQLTVLLNTKAEKLNVAAHQVVLDNGLVVKYEKCLIATGSTPKQIDIPVPEDCKDHVSTFRQYNDFLNLSLNAKDAKKILVVGGGFLGSELTVALVDRGKQNGNLKVVQAFPEAGMLGNVLPRYLSDYTTMKIREEGVDIRPDTFLRSVQKTESGRVEVNFTNDTNVEVDHIVFCLGVVPNVGLARGTGLELDAQNGGIIVNAELEARSDVYVAGDVCSYYDVVLGYRRRVEHHDHAYFTGIVAGENMTGEKRAYVHSSMYWSDLGNISFEAVGDIDRRLPSISFWANKPLVKSSADNPHPIAKIARHDPFQKGVIYCRFQSIENA